MAMNMRLVTQIMCEREIIIDIDRHYLPVSCEGALWMHDECTWKLSTLLASFRRSCMHLPKKGLSILSHCLHLTVALPVQRRSMSNVQKTDAFIHGRGAACSSWNQPIINPTPSNSLTPWISTLSSLTLLFSGLRFIKNIYTHIFKKG